MSHCYPFIIPNTDIEVDVMFNYSKRRPTVTQADPDQCHEAEGGEVEILKIDHFGDNLLPIIDDYVAEKLRVEIRIFMEGG